MSGKGKYGQITKSAAETRHRIPEHLEALRLTANDFSADYPVGVRFDICVL